MDGTVDKLNVQIGAHLPTLDSNMRQAEARVDQAAKKMEMSVKRADAAVSGVGSGMTVAAAARGGRGGRASQSPWRVAPGSEARYAFLGGLTATMAAMAVGRALNTEPGGSSQYGEASSKMLDFVDAIGKSIPVLNEFYEAGLKLSGKSASDRDMSRFGFGNTFRERLSLEAQALSGDPAQVAAAKRGMARLEARVQMEAMRGEIKKNNPIPPLQADETLTDMDGTVTVYKGNRAEVESATALQNSLLNAMDDWFRAQLESADRIIEPEVKKLESRFGVDSFGTPLGQFRSRWNQSPIGGDGSKQEGQSAQKTAANTGKLVTMMANAPVIRVFS